ncbi:MAG: hypothetical protein ABR497_07320 [Kiritimatiellia bacterium]|nr:hypothetical protein [Lentisphaerota bacterium]
MNEAPAPPRELTRITCMVQHLLEHQVLECLAALGVQSILVENARCVRQRIRPRAWGLPGHVTTLDDAPMDMFRAVVPRAAAGRVLRELAAAADLRIPGRGMLYAQQIVEFSRTPPLMITPDDAPSGMLRDMVLFTCILSMPGSGERFAEVALTLGAGVPVVSYGIGAGIRDRLGLLRITIPPEKEIVRLVVPAHDAAGIRRLLIEDGRLDRPGGGFLYQTPVCEGLIDPLLRIGRQQHAASMEQIIATLDEIKAGTSWRKRFVGLPADEDVALRVRRNYRELTFICAEGGADEYVRAAMAAGAGGATTAGARCLGAGMEDGGGVAREIGMLCVPAGLADAVLQALCVVAAQSADEDCRIQALDAPVVFMHQRKA